MNNSIHWKTIVPIIHKHLKGKLSEREQTLLDAWLAEDNNNVILLQEIHDENAFTNEMREYEGFHWMDGVEKLAASGVPIMSDQEVRRPIYWRFRYVMAAAAVVVMVVAGYLLISRTHNKDNKNEPVVAQKQQDLPPGKYRARLTLADGSTIVLDSVNTDSLTRQGMATVRNKNGKLEYNAAGTNGKNAALAMNTLTTAKAETYQLLLSDGSKVWLNAGSSIKFPVAFTESVRRVEITGEVYFEVAHNEKKPFIVKAGETEIEVLGTTFNVNSYPDEGAIKTTLLTGKVKINDSKQSAILKPGEQAQENKGNIQVSHEINVDQVVAWRYGLFQFNRDDIKTVMRQVARWYDVEVSYEGQIPKVEFWGKISRELSAAEMCKILERYGVHFRIEGKQIVVTP